MLFMIYIWIFVATLLVFVATEEFCPDNVRGSKHKAIIHNKTCYMFVDFEKYWDEARKYCWNMGGEMLVVDNMDTMQFIQNQLNSPKLGWRSRQGVWTGASDLRDRGWEWTTGERLSFQFWASGEPSKFLGFISMENCALMRRSDNWRWHDYHCHMSNFHYNFICQFPVVHGTHKSTEILHQTDHGAPLKVTDDTAAMIGLVIGGVALIAVMCTIIFYLHKKHQRQKKQTRPSIRYHNTGYAAIVHQSREGSSSHLIPASRPPSNIYLEPSDVTRIYEEVAKNNVNHGVNSLERTEETTHLVYEGEAGSMENLEDNGYVTPLSSLSGATSGYCSSNTVGMVASPSTGEYLEMSAPTGLNGHLQNDLALNSGANGDASDLKNKGPSQNGPKCSNLYVTACTNGSAAGKPMNVAPSDMERSDKSEMHIYTNQMDSLDKISLRPLPPVPTNEKSSVSLKSM